MRYNLSIKWAKAPAAGRVQVIRGEFHGLGIFIGTGQFENDRFRFSDAGPCHVTLAVDSDESEGPGATIISVVDTDQAFQFALRDVPSEGALPLAEVGVEVVAEADLWASL